MFHVLGEAGYLEKVIIRGTSTINVFVTLCFEYEFGRYSRFNRERHNWEALHDDLKKKETICFGLL